MAATASTHFGGEDDFVRRSGLCRPRRRKNSGDQTLYSRGFYYDAVGNRTRLSKDGTDSYYCYDDNNKLLRYRVGGSNCNTGGQLYSFTYDNNGNTLTTTYPDSTVATMTWDHENRMTQLQYPGQTVVGTYAYDGAGHRVQKVESGTTTNYAYDGDRVVLEMNSQLQTVARYTIEGSSYYSPLISMKRGGSSYYYLFDGLGSTRKLIDANQTVTDSYSYEAFGDITASSGSTTNPYRYVGALGYSYSTVVTSLLHVGARYYAPGVGRFMSQDPLTQDRNAYAYVSGSPVGTVDPEGLQPPIVPFIELLDTLRTILQLGGAIRIAQAINSVCHVCLTDGDIAGGFDLVEGQVGSDPNRTIIKSVEGVVSAAVTLSRSAWYVLEHPNEIPPTVRIPHGRRKETRIISRTTRVMCMRTPDGIYALLGGGWYCCSCRGIRGSTT